MIYNLTKKKDNLAQPTSEFFVLTSRGEVLRLSEVAPGGAHYQALSSSERRFISTLELRADIAGD